MTESTSYSYVIPAFNEEENIGQTLRSIQEFGTVYSETPPEVIVVDNGSTDATVEIARSFNARVFSQPDLTVAALRNFGVENTTGEVIIFLDADVLLTEKWRKNITSVLEGLRKNPDMVTGSNTVPVPSSNYFLKYWFSSFSEIEGDHNIGSAHLIVPRGLFDRLNGFDSTLETSEDFDLCNRARALGATVFNNPLLEVIHLDYPTTIKSFIKREMWHGSGECKSIRYAFQSKSFLASLVFVLLLAGILTLFGVGQLKAGFLLLVFLILFLLLSSYSKFRHSGAEYVLINAVIFTLFYIARSIAALKCFKLWLRGRRA